MKNMKLYLQGLDCANCATKIEARVNKLKGVEEATLNFATGALVVEIKDQSEKENLIVSIKDIINKLEPHVKVTHDDVKIINKNICTDCSENHNNHRKVAKGVKPVKINSSNKIEAFNGQREGYKDKVRYKNSHTKLDSYENDELHEHSNHDLHEGGHTHEHSHGHNHSDGKLGKKKFIEFGVAVALFIIGFVGNFEMKIEFLIFLTSYILIGGDVVLSAARNIKRGEVFDENFLMAVATLGAFAVKDFPEAVAVMIFYQVGEMFQDLAVNKSRKSISSLMDIRPDYANVKVGDTEKIVSPEEVTIGQIIIVKAGERVPLDGVVEIGDAMLDTSALTGESLPREVTSGDEVLAGCINKNGLLQIKVTKNFGESTVAKILDLVQNAGNKKAPTEKFITKFARYYTPAVVFSALALAVLPPLIIEGATFSQWIYRALTFLVVSCPCALVISIPLGFFGGIGAASKQGILVKGGNYLEALKNVETVVFDKTGTLTKGVFKVTKVKATSNLSNEELLELAAYAESYSNHPIATSIVREFKGEIKKELIENYEEVSGKGIKVDIKGQKILAGNNRLMEEAGIATSQVEEIGTVVHFALEGKYVGYVIISDELKVDSKYAIQSLKKMGVKQTIMLTGDSKKVGEAVGKEVGVDKVFGQLLPQNKVEKLEELFAQKSTKGKILFVGDGINDAPVLARADIGVAMGGVGSDAAIEAADVVIMTDEPSKIVEAINIARRTNTIVWQNIIFALSVKVIILILSAFGIASMWVAVFGDVGVALIAIINSMRVLKFRISEKK